MSLLFCQIASLFEKNVSSLPCFVELLLTCEAWLLETWKRLDPRVTNTDLKNRMVIDETYIGGKLKIPCDSAFANQMMRRCREVFNHFGLKAKRGEAHRHQIQALEHLDWTNFCYNTVLDQIFINGQHRLVKKKLTHKNDLKALKAENLEVTALNYLQTTFPIDHFIPKDEFGQNLLFPDEELLQLYQKCKTLYDVLLYRTEAHNLTHWSKLPKPCLPQSWFDRKGANNRPVRSAHEDGGCDVCTGEVSASTSPESTGGAATSFTSTGPVTPAGEKRQASPEGEDRASKRLHVEDEATALLDNTALPSYGLDFGFTDVLDDLYPDLSVPFLGPDGCIMWPFAGPEY